MNSMSPGPSEVSRPTRSPGFSSTGPEVVRSCTPISRAISMASVVLPRPGGPKKRVWSSVSRRPLAASMAIWSEVFTCACPMNSSSRDGRSAASAPVSSGSASGVVTWSSRHGISVARARAFHRTGRSPGSTMCHARQ